jgi:hypothetical protein
MPAPFSWTSRLCGLTKGNYFWSKGAGGFPPFVDFSATVVSDTEVDLSWQIKNTPAIAANIGVYYSVNTGATWVQLTGSLATNATSFNATGLTASTAYIFTVQFLDANGNLLGNAEATTPVGYSSTVTVSSTGNPTTDGTTLKNAILGATSGTLISVGAGTFNFGTTKVSVPDGVSVVGSGSASTIIETSAGTNINSTLRCPSNAILSDFGLVITALSASPLAIGCGAGDADSIDSFVYRIAVTGKNDAVYFSNENDDVVVTFVDCSFSSNFDTVRVVTAGQIINFWNCTFTITYLSASGSINRAVPTAAGELNFYDCSISVTNDVNPGTTYGLYSVGASAVNNAYNTSITVSNTAGGPNTYALITQTGGSIEVVNCTFNAALVSGSNITISGAPTTQYTQYVLPQPLVDGATVDLSWTLASQVPSAYKKLGVFTSTDGITYTAATQSLALSATSETITGLTASQGYTFAVEYLDANGLMIPNVAATTT